MPRAIPLPLRINIHLLPSRHILAAQVVHGDVFADLLLPDDLLVQDGCRAPLEDITLLLLAALVRLHEAPLERGLLFGDDRHVYVRARAQIVEDTRLDSIRRQSNGLLLCQVALPLRLEHRHRS